jgi:hypothetical protein
LSESVEKSVVIDVSASGLDDAVSGMENLGATARTFGTDFTRAGSSLDFLNKTFFTTKTQVVEIDAAGKEHIKTITTENQSLKDLAIGLQTVGAALRLLRIAEDIWNMMNNLAEAMGLVTTATEASASASAVATGAIEAQTDASWLDVAAEQARAMASFVANAVSSMGIAVPIMLAAAAAAIGLTAYFLTRSRQFGGVISESGPYMLEEGETVVPKSSSSPASGTSIGPILYGSEPGQGNLVVEPSAIDFAVGKYLLTSAQFGLYMPEGGLVWTHPGETVLPKSGGPVQLTVDARGSSFASDYNVDKMMDRVIDRLKRAGVIER